MNKISNTKTIFSCQGCGYQSAKWLGRCPECSQWNSFAEEVINNASAQRKSVIDDIVPQALAYRIADVKLDNFYRTKTDIGELDRVLGGGLVAGSVVLVGGEPGIGKSTLMLQVCNIIARDKKVLYISGEESCGQIKLRAERLGVLADKLYLLNETNLNFIINNIKELKPYLVVIDSIQTIYGPGISQGAGTVSQVRECAAILTTLAKASGISIFIIGHITKEGLIAGPKILEHIVDSVIYFEGEKNFSFRILRTVKNRFGPTDEIGIFSMGADGLAEVKDPTGVFISKDEKPSCGSTITAAIEGTRPLLVEVQALVGRSNFGMPRQRCMGFDINRMVLLIAVLEKSMGLNISNCDVFLNVVGGIRLDEPAADLAAAISIISSFKDRPIRKDTVIIGEVGLLSEVRAVSQIRARVNEAQRLGFKRCIIPRGDMKENSSLKLIAVNNIKEATEHAFS